MATYQKVKFTGERTGLAEIRTPGARLKVGDEAIVPADIAAAWAQPQVTAEFDDEGKQVEKADFELVGEELDEEAYQAALDAEAEAAAESELAEKSKADLQAEAAAAGLSTSGTKAELQERLAEASAAGSQDEPAADDVAGDGEEK